MTSRRNTTALAIWLFFVVAHANPTEAALLTTIVGWDTSPVFSDPPSGFEYCGKVTTVFGVAMCVTANAWAAGEAKSSHVANVFYQLLDNDADGCVDDAAILDKMITGNYMLLLSDGSESVSDDSITASGVKQYGDLGTSEVYVNSCDVPSNRGAINTDRTTWAANADLTGKTCETSRDASTEEVLHLITEAAHVLYAAKWGNTFSSTVGAALSTANGNCGWGKDSNYLNPGTNGQCVGKYAYSDSTCDTACIVTEGIYWASVTYMGGLYTNTRTTGIKDEWLMGVPDSSMTALPSGVTNAATLESGSPTLYALVSDATSADSVWLPTIMPDGKYIASPNCKSDSIWTLWYFIAALVVGGIILIVGASFLIYRCCSIKKRMSCAKVGDSTGQTSS